MSDTIWQETAWHYAKGMEYYRGLLEEIAECLGPSVYMSDDGSVQDDPVLAKIPEMIRDLVNDCGTDNDT